MSETPEHSLDIRAVIARIDRDLAESAKLRAEARKFNRDPWFVALGAFAVAVAARLPEILNGIGTLLRGHP